MHAQELYDGSSNRSKSRFAAGSDQQHQAYNERAQGKKNQSSLGDGDGIRSEYDNGDEYNENNLVKKRDTHKIRTNPKYRCVDDGSDDGVDDGKQEDY
jgi:hypothetical protein